MRFHVLRLRHPDRLFISFYMGCILVITVVSPLGSVQQKAAVSVFFSDCFKLLNQPLKLA